MLDLLLNGSWRPAQRSDSVIPEFDVACPIEIDKGSLPPPPTMEEWEEDLGGGNEEYFPMPQVDWDSVRYAIGLEGSLIEKCDVGSTTSEAFEELANEIRNGFSEVDHDDDLDVGQWFWCMDLGVVSTVLALSALGCLTTASCRGHPGTFREVPYVRFRAEQHHAEPLIHAARESACGLTWSDNRAVEVVAEDIRQLMRFAELLVPDPSGASGTSI